jgi:hypothetical protein
LSEDGLIYQPVKHLASLRTIPNLQVFPRRCGGNRQGLGNRPDQPVHPLGPGLGQAAYQGRELMALITLR